MKRVRVLATAFVLGAACLTTMAPGASAHAARTSGSSTTAAPSRLGATTVTTARGVAQTLISAGITPSGAPDTGVRTRTGDRGLRAAFTFPVTSSTADLGAGTGDILHSGGIVLTGSNGTTLEVGKFDIDLAAGKVFATEVNGSAAHLAVLDLNLANLSPSTNANGATVLRGIGVSLDPEAASAINSTFGLSLPTEAPLLNFGRARVVLN